MKIGEVKERTRPRHITPRYTEAEIAAAVAPLHEQIDSLKAQLARAKAQSR